MVSEKTLQMGEQTRAEEVFWAFNPEMPVDVLADFSELLFSGRLTAHSQESLTIEQIAGEISFPVLNKGTSVVVRAYDTKMEPFTLWAVVAKSFSTECVLGQLKPILHAQQRKSVRYPLSPPANVYALEDTQLDSPQKCRLVNISTGGACIVSVRDYEPGEVVRLRVELVENRGQRLYNCKVVRATQRPDGQCEYGLLFVEMKQQSVAELQRDIEAAQAEAKKRIKG